ncbi:MAG: hypothetical protein ABTQ29_00795 [Siculibacillus sp.]
MTFVSRSASASLVVLACLSATPAAAASIVCPLTRAVYTALDADDDMSAEEGKTNAYEITHVADRSDASDRPWLLRISEGRRRQAYDFAVVHPPGFGGAHLVMMPRSAGSRKAGEGEIPTSRLLYFGDDLRRADPAADPEPLAPPWLQLPGISPAFWAWKRDGRRFVPPDGMWRLTACRG